MAIQVDIEKTPEPDPRADELAGKAPIESGGKELPPDDPTKTLETEIERVKDLPEKFESVGDLASAYRELERKQSKENATSDLSLDAGDDPEQPTFNSEKYQQEFVTDGELSEASLGEIKKLGIDQGFVDAHMHGLEALKEAQVDVLLDIANGGKMSALRDESRDAFDKVRSWAKVNLPDSDKDAFAEAMQSGNSNTMHLAMSGLVARFRASSAGQETLIEGPSAGSAIQPYESTEQVQEAMRDPAYKRDPAYRERVEARIRAGLRTGTSTRIR